MTIGYKIAVMALQVFMAVNLFMIVFNAMRGHGDRVLAHFFCFAAGYFAVVITLMTEAGGW